MWAQDAPVSSIDKKDICKVHVARYADAMSAAPTDKLKMRIIAHAATLSGAPLTAADVADFGTPAAVSQTLSRMAKSGALRRVGRGAYVLNAQAAPSTAGAAPHRRDIILSVATRLFAERGFFGVSIRDIALESGINAATIYHHFPDKVSLHDEVVRLAWDESSRQIRPPYDADASPRAQFERWIANIAAFHLSQSEAARIRDREMFLGRWESLRASGNFLALTRTNVEQLERLVEDMRPPILQTMSAWRLCEMVHGLIYGVIKSLPGARLVKQDREAPNAARITEEVIAFITPIMGWSYGPER